MELLLMRNIKVSPNYSRSPATLETAKKDALFVEAHLNELPYKFVRSFNGVTVAWEHTPTGAEPSNSAAYIYLTADGSMHFTINNRNLPYKEWLGKNTGEKFELLKAKLNRAEANHRKNVRAKARREEKAFERQVRDFESRTKGESIYDV